MIGRYQQEDQRCEKHNFVPLGFSVFKTTETTVEAVGAITCSKCGLFRTKILVFRREFQTKPEVDLNIPKEIKGIPRY